MKILKTILIIIFALLFVISGGLLVYGALQGPKIEIEEESAAYSAPASNLYLGEYADKKIDITAIKDDNSISSSAEKVATMIINASYNNIYINQFYYKANVEVEPTENSDKYACSEYYRAKTGANMFYQTLAYTGTPFNPLQVKIDYGNQRLATSDLATCEYDTDTKKWSYNPTPATVKNNSSSVTLPDPTPYNIYSWYDFPLDLGGIKTCEGGSTEGRTEGIDGSLIDEKSVKIEEMQDADGNLFYRLKFKAIIEKTQNSSESKDRFSSSFSSLKNLEFSELTFEVDIWKEEGVFRKIQFDARVTASIGSDRGEVVINKVLAFSYDDHDASVAWHIKKLSDTFTNNWMKKWNAENQAAIQADLDALPEKTTDEAVAE